MKSAFDLILYVFPFAIVVSMPMLITALGGLFSERSGVINIGLEGLMLVGSFTSALFSSSLYGIMGQSAIWLSLPVAMLGGMLFSLLHAFASVSLNANQVISGTAINMIAAAVTLFWARQMTGSGTIPVPVGGLSRFDVPLLCKIPLLGPMFFTGTYGTTWIILFILLASAFVLYKTSFGLRLRSCGENPYAAEAAGIHVRRVRYMGVMISGAYAGLGGAAYMLCFSKEYTGNMYGLGFLALAALIFGQWKPLGVLLATLFFGFASALSNISGAIPQLSSIPDIVLKTFPYLVTLAALILSSRNSAAPSAAGQPFEADAR